MAYEGLPPFWNQSFNISKVPPKFRWAWNGIYACIPAWESGGGALDFVNNIVGTPVGNVSYVNSYQGQELSFDASTYLDFGALTQFGSPLYGSITLAAIHSPVSTDQNALWVYAGEGSGSAPFSIIYSYGSNSQYTFWNDNNAHGPSSTTTFAAGTRNFVIARRTGDHAANPTLELFVNGRLLGTTTNTTLDINWDQASASTNPRLSVNRFGAFNGYMGASIISNIMLWNRALNDQEIQALTEDPYGPIRQLRQEHVFFFNTLGAPPSTTRLSPDSIAAATNLTGAVSVIQDDPDSPDANWLTATSATAATDIRVTFPTPPGNPISSQGFKYQLRKTTGATTPTYTASLYQGGSLISALETDVSVTSTAGEVHSVSWPASSLVTVLDGSDVELRIASTVGTSAPTLGAVPAYNTFGTVISSSTMPNTQDVVIPAHTSGDLLLLHVLTRNTNNDGLLASINTANWTQGGGTGTAYGGAQNARQGFGWKIGDGSEAAVNITTTGGTTTDRLVTCVYRFTAANGFAASPLQNISTSNQSGTTANTSVTMPSVTRVTANDLAVCLIASNTTSAAISDATGESNGDWTESTQQGTTNGVIGIQTSGYTSTSITGGTATITSSQWVAVAFTLVPADVPGSAVNTIEIGAAEWNVSYTEPPAGGLISGIFGMSGTFGGLVLR